MLEQLAVQWALLKVIANGRRESGLDHQPLAQNMSPSTVPVAHTEAERVQNGAGEPMVPILVIDKAAGNVGMEWVLFIEFTPNWTPSLRAGIAS